MENMGFDAIQKRIAELKEEQLKLEAESVKLMNQNGGAGMYTIRPAARHILTIGEDLIQDQCAAVIELVKNAYDADSLLVEIVFTRQKNGNVQIIIKDNGHGMSVDDIVNKWLVPSTDNKKVNRISPSGRVMQGRKGIGRYAASILGDGFCMKSITTNGKCNTVSFNWNMFNDSSYLDQVQINLNSEPTTEPSGTTITIMGDSQQTQYWNEYNIKKLKFQLKRLITPYELSGDLDFRIIMSFNEFYEDATLNISEQIDPFPILDLFDYRISGKIDRYGNGVLTYECKKITPNITDVIDFSNGSETGCGELSYDIRVFDRDSESIDWLINRGLKSVLNVAQINKNDAKKLINDISGIGVYRNGFRIRPLGDPDFDWLKLNKARIQNPSLKIGGDQVSGYVQIQSEEESHLEEKSARDGLKENEAFEALKYITNKVIQILEEKRYALRRELGLSRPGKKLESQLDSLYDYSKLKKSVRTKLKEAGLNETTILVVDNLIEEEKQKKNDTIDDIRKAVALYQGQATVGKIVYVLLHEGRRPLNYIKGQVPNLKYYEEKYKKTNDPIASSKIVEISSGIEQNTKHFVELFSKIDPLSSKRRQPPKSFSIKTMLETVLAVFESELKTDKIETIIICDSEAKFFGWEQDFYAIFTNLIDNSIFWIEETKCNTKKITIDVDCKENKLSIRYSDSGPGISKELIESGVIFEPDFSTKPNGGSGLGLAIAGEAADRNDLVLSAEESDRGALFILSRKEG